MRRCAVRPAHPCPALSNACVFPHFFFFSAAVGAEFPKDLTNLEGTDAEGDIEGGRLACFSFPVEVKDYEAFDQEAFTEMK